MLDNIAAFLLYWAIIALSLWAASHIFKGLKFESGGALAASALLLGFVNALVKPILIMLTLPLTLITFGLFLLVINALTLLLVAAMVRGFRISGFWTALFASLFISILSTAIGSLLGNDNPETTIQMPSSGNWI